MRHLKILENFYGGNFFLCWKNSLTECYQIAINMIN